MRFHEEYEAFQRCSIELQRGSTGVSGYSRGLLRVLGMFQRLSGSFKSVREVFFTNS